MRKRLSLVVVPGLSLWSRLTALLIDRLISSLLEVLCLPLCLISPTSDANNSDGSIFVWFLKNDEDLSTIRSSSMRGTFNAVAWTRFWSGRGISWYWHYGTMLWNQEAIALNIQKRGRLSHALHIFISATRPSSLCNVQNDDEIAAISSLRHNRITTRGAWERADISQVTFLTWFLNCSGDAYIVYGM